MALKSRVFDDLLHFASTSRSRSAVTLAAVSFAICHLFVLGTSPAPANATAELPGEIPRQLIHFVAELCRFSLPLGVMMVGMMQQRKRR
jgi:hypothetical protein